MDPISLSFNPTEIGPKTSKPHRDGHDWATWLGGIVWGTFSCHLAQLFGIELSQQWSDSDSTSDVMQKPGVYFGLHDRVENKHTQAASFLVLASGYVLFWLLTLLSCSLESLVGVWCCTKPGIVPHLEDALMKTFQWGCYLKWVEPRGKSLISTRPWIDFKYVRPQKCGFSLHRS